MKYRWLSGSPQPLLTAPLTADLGLPALLAQCLVNRGIQTADAAQRFLRPQLKQMRDPSLIPNLDRAVDRLWRARERGERVLVFGDYDVDGVTATALLLEVLRALGWTVNHYLPHRLDEGYGLTREAVENCLEQHPASLLLAVDCGSTAADTIDWLARQGTDVIVLDHHQVSSPPPAAVAVVNPQVAEAGAPDFRELCSVGLAFKLAHAIVKRGRRSGWPEAESFDVRPLLDYVALGTIADLVPLVGENRILTAVGLERLNILERPGLRALKGAAAIPGRIGPYEVAFQLAPRLNAAGRLEHATEALDLLLAPDMASAEPLAASLDARNAERQAIERGIAEQVIGAVRANFDPGRDYVIVEGQLLWHLGVVGIVASRVLSEFYRPTIILGGDGHEWRGSGRSIEGFDLAAALRQCADLLVRHGGHAMAAGLTVAPENVPRLRARLNELARQTLTPEQLRPPLRLDADCALGDLTLDVLEGLARLQPTGQGNPPVQVMVRNVHHRRDPVHLGREHQHAKFWVTDGSHTIETVWWTGGDKPWPQGTFDVAGVPQVNEFDGRRIVQLRLLDWRPASD